MNDVYHFPLNETSTNCHHHHQQPHQDDDDDDNDDDDPLNENYIALLHYRSPHHILDLSPQATPAEIRRAHAIRVDETRQALHLAETNGGGGASFMSRLNYLELKLRALDQARHSLLSSSSSPDAGRTPVDRGTLDSSRHDDELDTIDIYFRPRPIAQRSTSRTSWSSSASRHSLDNVSSVSWDASRQAPDDEDDGVSQVLGPLHVDTSLAKKKKQPPSNESPRSIVDLTQEDEDVFDIDRTADRNRNRHKPPKPASLRPTTIPTAQCTIEAARKGVLRALSEDDSECLPLEEDEYDPPRPPDDPHASHWVKRTAPEEPREGQVPREKVVTWDTTSHAAARPDEEDPPESHRSASSQPSASPRSETSERRVSAGTHNDPHIPHDDTYDTLLRSGMAFAHDLCGLLGVCWEAGNDTTTTHGIFVSPGEGMDEESYLVQGGAENDDDDEYGADGESYSALDSVGGGSYAGRGGREKKMLV